MKQIKQKPLEEHLKLYFIMGSTNCHDLPSKVLEEAIKGGITMFQFREKGDGALEGTEKYRIAKQLKEICLEYGIPFIVNDDVKLAVDLDADGVHVGQEDASAGQVRERIGDKILGVSAHTLNEADQAMADGADYLGLGPIFPTDTKADTRKIQGPDIISLFREEGMTIPIVGIGGINKNNAHEVMEAGADGISVISAISGADSVKIAAERLKSTIK